MTDQETKPLRLTMWSGPRNLSTAMMRSFGARADTVCVDEPFYACYLKLTGYEHPMTAEIFEAQSDDPRQVIEALRHPPKAAPIIYEKHMAHHMVPEIETDWVLETTPAFLVRHPARVIASYAQKMETVTLEGIGFSQQEKLFDLVQSNASASRPVVVDSDDVLIAPEPVLMRLCAALGISFDPAMLSWAAGPKPEDGVWAPHWYDSVNASTGFATGAPKPLPPVDPTHSAVFDAAMEIYERLSVFKV